MSVYNIVANSPSIDISNIEEENLVFLDGAANLFFDTHFKPIWIVGDMDSIEKHVMELYLSKGVKIIKIDDQETTDLEKAIILCKKDNNLREINIYNAIGGRLDHSILNLRILRRYFSHNYQITLLSTDEKIIFFRDTNLILKGKLGSKVAIISFPKAIVTSNGLLYEINNRTLEFSLSESTSNSIAKCIVTLSITGDILLITVPDVSIEVVCSKHVLNHQLL